MEKEYKKLGTIRGTRHDIVLSKICKGIPGFAPETYTKEVGHICTKFLDGEPPFIQFFNKPPILEIDEVEEVLNLMKRGYKEEDNYQFEEKVN